MSGFITWLQQLRFDSILETVVLVAASLLCITFHETCHGLAAYWMGDDTAKRMGRLTLNPLKHVDIVGLIMMALVKFGWAKPVPVDMRKFRNPKLGMALTAIAGPLSNVLMAFVAVLLHAVTLLFCIKYPETTLLEYLDLFFLYTALLSTGLAVFNLFPIPPLDGSKFLLAFLPDEAYLTVLRYERYGMLLLIVLLTTNVLDGPLIFLRELLLDAMTTAVQPLFDFMLRRSL